MTSVGCWRWERPVRPDWTFRRPCQAALALPTLLAAEDGSFSPMQRRISHLIETYEHQGFHRTGTLVDRQSGAWLCGEVRRAGLVPSQESFALSRIDPLKTALIVGGRRIEGEPLFDGGFTGASGVLGRLGPLDSSAEIGLVETVPNAAASGPLGDARRADRHRAIIAITRGGRPGLCPSNADSFLQPFGPPVLQVSSQEATWRTPAQAINVTARIDGADRARLPLVVMTPRSGWFSCASERGGGLACWLEVMRALSRARPARTVLFVASSGHELGHLGLRNYLDRRPGLVQKSMGWMHLGANIGAATDPANNLQASDEDFAALIGQAMLSFGLRIDRQIPNDRIPAGEARMVQEGGGRYLSLTGRNALFHSPDDHGPGAVDPAVIARFVAALTVVASRLASA
jgi:hypothetical protein